MAKSQGKNKPRIRKAPTVKVPAVSQPDRQKSSRRLKLRSKLPESALAKNPLLITLLRVGRVLRKVLGFVIPRYFINSWREVRQVTWPNRRETWRLTLAVFIFAVVFGSLVAGVDKVIDEIFKKLILK